MTEFLLVVEGVAAHVRAALKDVDASHDMSVCEILDIVCSANIVGSLLNVGAVRPTLGTIPDP